MIAIVVTTTTATKTVINPTHRLLAAAGNPPLQYVRTCRSDTCSCFSHDAGYHSAEVPAHLPTFEHGGSVHSHPSTELLDERGKLVQNLVRMGANARHSYPGSNCSRAGRREHERDLYNLEVARDSLFLFDNDFGSVADCLRMAKQRVEIMTLVLDRKARMERRTKAIETMVTAGIPEYAARALYGAGPWSNELSPADWVSLADLGHETLSRAANARSNRELDSLNLPVNGSHPRRTAWARYAAVAFFGSVLDIPARETWRDIARRKGVTVR